MTTTVNNKSTPRISGVKSAMPEFIVEQKDARTFASKHFADRIKSLDKMLAVFDNAQIDRRFFCRPLEWYSENRSLPEKNEIYIEQAVFLSAKAINSLLQSTNTKQEEIDYIIYVNSTGLATPSIDARLIGSLNLPSHIRRTPVWGLGCAGGAAGLAQAYHYLLGHPYDRVIVVTAEFCSLTFLADDYSRSNLVASALFGDGVAAALVVGSEVRCEGPQIVATQSTLFPDSLDVMGWHVVDEGLQVVFAQRIPQMVLRHSRYDVSKLLKEHSLTFENIDLYLFHPGGAKVLDAYCQAIPESKGKLEYSSTILKEYGNISSVTVLLVLERFLENSAKTKGQYALLSALGPGFSSETVLLKK